MSILVVGSVAYDNLETPFGKEPRVLGGAATHFSASASFFSPIRLVGVVGRDFDHSEIGFLKKRGVDFGGLQTRADGNTFLWKGRYGYDLNEAQTLETHLNVFADFDPILPENFKTSDFVFLANIDPVLQLKVLRQVQKPKFIAMDTMNFWITGKSKELKETISHADILLINESEARQLAGEQNLVKAAKKIRGWGPKIVTIKRGEYGALLFTDHSVFSAPGFPLEELKDPTGAGDSFAGGFIGFLAKCGGDLSTGNLKKAMIVGSVMASFQVEEFGLRRMLSLTVGDIQERLQAFKTLSHFEWITL